MVLSGGFPEARAHHVSMADSCRNGTETTLTAKEGGQPRVIVAGKLEDCRMKHINYSRSCRISLDFSDSIMSHESFATFCIVRISRRDGSTLKRYSVEICRS